MATTCIFHPDRPAVARCFQCHKPLCQECRVIEATRVFCSSKCASRYRTFHLHYVKEATKPRYWRVFYTFICVVLILFIIRLIAHAGAGLGIPILEALNNFFKEFLF